MKPGDLVKLVSHVCPEVVYVAFFDAPKQGAFNNGTHALFLGSIFGRTSLCRSQESKSSKF